MNARRFHHLGRPVQRAVARRFCQSDDMQAALVRGADSANRKSQSCSDNHGIALRPCQAGASSPPRSTQPLHSLSLYRHLLGACYGLHDRERVGLVLHKCGRGEGTAEERHLKVRLRLRVRLRVRLRLRVQLRVRLRVRLRLRLRLRVRLRLGLRLGLRLKTARATARRGLDVPDSARRVTPSQAGECVHESAPRRSGKLASGSTRWAFEQDSDRAA